MPLPGSSALRPAPISAGLFQSFSRLAYEHAGIRLRQGKEALLCGRISRRLRQLGLCDFRSYLTLLQTDTTGEELIHFLNAIATNTTSFFREMEHFDVLTASVKRWLASGQRAFTLWSAAASTGEEPYSLAMTMAEALASSGASYRLLATDISTRTLAIAEAGQYGNNAVRTVNGALRQRYFSIDRQRERHRTWSVRPELRAHVTFARMNLATPPFPMRGPFDVILCRNVMIYFDDTVRRRLVADMVRLLRRGGLLMVGHAETLTGMESGLTMLRPSIYTR